VSSPKHILHLSSGSLKYDTISDNGYDILTGNE